MLTLDALCAPWLPPDDHSTLPSRIIAEPQLILLAAMIAAHSTCPAGRQPSDRLHGHSRRTLADFPWATAPLARRVLGRRFRGCPGTCRRQTCAQRLPSVAPLSARTTTRLATTHANPGLVLGGAAGARPWSRPGSPVRRQTLRRRVCRVSLPGGPAPASLGIDDWAGRHGQRYGTLLVARQRGCPLDVLAARAAAPVAPGLSAHPDGKLVARDRAAASAAGRRPGAPAATQVADRWHRRKPVAAALPEVFRVPHRERD
jgi:transposase